MVSRKEMNVMAEEISMINDLEHRRTAMIVMNNALGRLNENFDPDKWAAACGCNPLEGKQ